MLFNKNVRQPFDLAELQVSGSFRPVLGSLLLEQLDGEGLAALASAAEGGEADAAFLPRAVRLFRLVILAADVTWNVRDMASEGAPVVDVTAENLDHIDDALILELGSVIFAESMERLGNFRAPSRSCSEPAAPTGEPVATVAQTESG